MQVYVGGQINITMDSKFSKKKILIHYLDSSTWEMCL